MALFVKQETNRSELQKRISAELSEKAKKKAKEAESLPDGVDDSAFVQGTKQTTSLAWLWVLIVIAVVGVAIWLFVSTGNQR